MADFVQHPVVAALAWALVHFMWQGAAIGLASVIAFKVMRHSPSVRYAIGVGALVAMIAAPVATFLVLRSEPSANATTGGGESAVDTVPVPSLESTAAPVATPVRGSLPVAPEVLAVAVVGWLGGVAFFAIRLLGGWFVARRLAHRAVQPASDHLQAVARQLAARLAIDRVVTILQSHAVAVPVMIGWLKPAIVLPMAALAGLNPAQMEALLAHELAHVRRHDYLVNLLQSVAEALLFYHPAVWWLSRRVRAERELCCDDLAVSVCDRLVYATALTDLAAMTAPGIALAATDGDLLGRVRRILGQSDAAPAIRAGAMPLLALVLVAGVAVPVTLASSQPPARPQEIVAAPAQVAANAATTQLDNIATVQTTQQQAERQRAEAELKRRLEERQREALQLDLQRTLVEREQASTVAQEKNELARKMREIELASAQRQFEEMKRKFEVGLVSESQLKEAQATLAKAEANGNPQALQALELKIAAERLARSRELVEMGLLSATDLAAQEEQLKLLELQLLKAREERALDQRLMEVRPEPAQAQRTAAEAANANQLYELLAARRVVDGQPVGAADPVKAGDYLRITIEGESDLRTSYRVSDEGTIRMPLLGTIKVIGLTAAQVRDAVGKQLAAHKLGSTEQVAVVVTRVRRAR